MVLDKKIDVLDQGFVRVVDTMGDDSAIVQAARISYGKGTKTVREDRGLIRYLMRHRHTTPFEMCEIKFHVKVPMDCWRQWIRHRTASVNEYSTRYSEAINEKQETSSVDWRLQSSKNKQGSGDYLDKEIGQELSKQEAAFHSFAEAVYKSRLAHGVAREQARKDLPLSTYTEAYWKIDLHNLLHFLKLRMDPHAQKEIRQYAWAMAAFVEEWVPLTWEAFKDYQLDSMLVSGPERSILREVLSEHASNLEFHIEHSSKLSKREKDEFRRKLGIATD